MKPVKLQPGSFVVDTDAILTEDNLDELTATRLDVRGVFRYRPELTLGEIQRIHSRGLVVGLLNHGVNLNGPETVAWLQALGIPKGVDHWCDVEGDAMLDVNVGTRINAWAHALQGALYGAKMYCAAGCPFTSKELYALAVTGYAKGASLLRDRFGNDVCPGCDFSWYQGRPVEIEIGGVKYDVGSVFADNRGREIVFVGAD